MPPCSGRVGKGPQGTYAQGLGHRLFIGAPGVENTWKLNVAGVVMWSKL